MYVAMGRNPENGSYTQNDTCGRSGIMMWLMIVKYENNEEDQKDNKDNLSHGTKVLKELVIPWANMDKTVCAYSYSASVPAPE